MAKVNLTRDDIANSLTIEVDMAEVRREFYGFLRWRYHLAIFLIGMAGLVLGIKVDVKGDKLNG